MRAHMQQKLIFKSKGLNCSGLFYLPDNYSATDREKLPAIAMGTTKEVGLPHFAERFADAGFRRSAPVETQFSRRSHDRL